MVKMMENRLRIVIIFLVMLGLGPVAWALDDDYADRMRFADGLFARQMYDMALGEYRAILEAFPEGERSDAALFRKAESLRQLGELDAAALIYGRVVTQFRESPYRLRAAYRRARLYTEAGEHAAAQAHYEVILTEDPDAELAAATKYYLGHSFFARNQLDQADATMERLLDAYPESAFETFALLKRANIRRRRLSRELEDTGQLDTNLVEEALMFYQLARQVADTDRLQAEVLYQKADLYFRQDLYEEAAALYRELLRAHPNDPRVQDAGLQAAWSALRSGLYAEALSIADSRIADDPGGSHADEWLYIQANSQRQLLQTKAAAETYQVLRERFPESRFANAAQYETAVAYYKAGDYEEAIRAAEDIRLVADKAQDVNWLLAESYAALDRAPEAVQHYRLVVRDGGTSERVHDALYRLAHHLRQKEEYREAAAFYQQLAETFPESSLAPQSLFAAGYSHSRAGAHESAVRDWRLLVRDYPDDALAEEALYHKAMGEIRLERNQDAMGTLSELQRVYPDSRYMPDVYYWQGMLHFEGGRYEEAEPLLREAVEMATRDTLRRDATFQLGVVLQRLDQSTESAALLYDLIETPVRDRFPPALLEWLAAHHGAEEQYEQMVKVASLLMEHSEPAWQQSGKTLLGRAYAALDEEAEAEEAWRGALDLDVRTTYAGEAALRLGLLFLSQELFDEARTYLQRVSGLATGSEADAVRARSLLGLGKVALGQEEPDEAARLFLSVGILYDDADLVPESLYLAAQSFAAQDREEDVEQVVSELLERYPDSVWSEKARGEWEP